jgi:hypothetical protein
VQGANVARRGTPYRHATWGRRAPSKGLSFLAQLVLPAGDGVWRPACGASADARLQDALSQSQSNFRPRPLPLQPGSLLLDANDHCIDDSIRVVTRLLLERFGKYESRSRDARRPNWKMLESGRRSTPGYRVKAVSITRHDHTVRPLQPTYRSAHLRGEAHRRTGCNLVIATRIRFGGVDGTRTRDPRRDRPVF